MISIKEVNLLADSSWWARCEALTGRVARTQGDEDALLSLPISARP